jgi:hypothetical protein
MPGYECDPGVDHLVGHRDRLLGIAGVVADLEHQLLAEDAAGLVEVLDRHLGATLHLLAEGGILAGHGPGRGDHHVGLSGTGGQSDGRASKERLGKASHMDLLPGCFEATRDPWPRHHRARHAGASLAHLSSSRCVLASGLEWRRLLRSARVS